MSNQNDIIEALPRYLRVATVLRQEILAGVHPPNAMLPSRRALAQQFAVAQPTIDRAIAALVSEGCLRVDSRRGTFVTGKSPVPRGSVLVGASSLNQVHPPAIVGVITTLHDMDEGDANQRLWSTTICTTLEQSLAGDGSTFRFVNRFQGRGEELLSTEEAVAQLRTQGSTAIVVAADIGAMPATVRTLVRTGLPFVVVSAVDIRQPVSAVVFDNFAAGYQAAEHLLAIGHREITFIAPFTDNWVEERIAGVRLALADAGLPASALVIHPCQPKSARVLRQVTYHIYQQPGYLAAREAINTGTLGRAIIAINDLTAFGVLKATEEAGLEAGRDFAIIGFDDHPNARFRNLTTQRPPLAEMGREACRLLTRVLAGGTTTSLQVRMRPTIVPRGSTAGG